MNHLLGMNLLSSQGITNAFVSNEKYTYSCYTRVIHHSYVCGNNNNNNNNNIWRCRCDTCEQESKEDFDAVLLFEVRAQKLYIICRTSNFVCSLHIFSCFVFFFLCVRVSSAIKMKSISSINSNLFFLFLCSSCILFFVLEFSYDLLFKPPSLGKTERPFEKYFSKDFRRINDSIVFVKLNSLWTSIAFSFNLFNHSIYGLI